jgi:hypothetical protein
MCIAAIMYTLLLVAVFSLVSIDSCLAGLYRIYDWLNYSSQTIWKPKAEVEVAKRSLNQRPGFRTPNATESYAITFVRPYPVFTYPAVFLPSIWFSVCYMNEVPTPLAFSSLLQRFQVQFQYTASRFLELH